MIWLAKRIATCKIGSFGISCYMRITFNYFLINLLNCSANSGPYRELPSHNLSMGSIESLIIKGTEDPLHCRHWWAHGNKLWSSWGPFWNLRHCGSWCTPIFLWTVVCRTYMGIEGELGTYSQPWREFTNNFHNIHCQASNKFFWEIEKNVISCSCNKYFQIRGRGL